MIALADARKRVNQSRRWGVRPRRVRACRLIEIKPPHSLGFDGVRSNSLDVSSDRDFLVEYVSVLWD